MTIGTIHASEKLAKIGTNGNVTKGQDRKNTIMRKKKIPALTNKTNQV